MREAFFEEGNRTLFGRSEKERDGDGEQKNHDVGFGHFFGTMRLTVGQCNGAFLGIDGEESSLVANVSFRDEADL